LARHRQALDILGRFEHNGEVDFRTRHEWHLYDAKPPDLEKARNRCGRRGEQAVSFAFDEDLIIGDETDVDRFAAMQQRCRNHTKRKVGLSRP